MEAALDPARELSGELSSEERLLWSGCPRQGFFFRSSDVFMIPFSLLWGGFAIFWEVSVLAHLGGHNSDGAPTAVLVVFSLFGIPFVLVGFYIIFGRFIVDKKQREETVYGVTNQRIIIRTGLFTISTKSLNLRTLSDLSLEEKSDGYGIISFGPVNPYYSRFGSGGGSAWPGRSRYAPPCFDMIPEVKRVYEIIRQAQNADELS
jgi:hypothetical protein